MSGLLRKGLSRGEGVLVLACCLSASLECGLRVINQIFSPIIPRACGGNLGLGCLRAQALCLLLQACGGQHVPAWPQHSRSGGPAVVLSWELCKGKKQWDLPSHPVWLQGLLGRPDVHHTTQLEQTKIHRSCVQRTGEQWLEVGLGLLWEFGAISLSAWKKGVASRH